MDSWHEWEEQLHGLLQRQKLQRQLQQEHEKEQQQQENLHQQEQEIHDHHQQEEEQQQQQQHQTKEADLLGELNAMRAGFAKTEDQWRRVTGQFYRDPHSLDHKIFLGLLRWLLNDLDSLVARFMTFRHQHVTHVQDSVTVNHRQQVLEETPHNNLGQHRQPPALIQREDDETFNNTLGQHRQPLTLIQHEADENFYNSFSEHRQPPTLVQHKTEETVGQHRQLHKTEETCHNLGQHIQHTEFTSVLQQRTEKTRQSLDLHTQRRSLPATFQQQAKASNVNLEHRAHHSQPRAVCHVQAEEVNCLGHDQRTQDHTQENEGCQQRHHSSILSQEQTHETRCELVDHVQCTPRSRSVSQCPRQGLHNKLDQHVQHTQASVTLQQQTEELYHSLGNFVQTKLTEFMVHIHDPLQALSSSCHHSTVFREERGSHVTGRCDVMQGKRSSAHLLAQQVAKRSRDQ